MIRPCTNINVETMMRSVTAKQDWDILGIASQANVGGASTALACAKSLGREDLGLAAILIGALGNATGTYWGLLMAEILRGYF